MLILALRLFVACRKYSFSQFRYIIIVGSWGATGDDQENDRSKRKLQFRLNKLRWTQDRVIDVRIGDFAKHVWRLYDSSCHLHQFITLLQNSMQTGTTFCDLWTYVVVRGMCQEWGNSPLELPVEGLWVHTCSGAFLMNFNCYYNYYNNYNLLCLWLIS